MSGRRDWFGSFESYRSSNTVSLANNTSVEPVGRGTVPVLALINGQWETCNIENVLYVPGMKNLFSEAAMVKKGYTIISNRKGAIFYDEEGREGPVSIFKEDMFIMAFKNSQKPQAMAAQKENLELWHQRMAHVNVKAILETAKSGAVKGLDLQTTDEKLFCEPCEYGKQACLPYLPVIEKRNMKPGEMAHVDTAGPFPTESLGGARFFLLIKDDATGFRAIYFMRSKSEAPDDIKDYIKMIEKQTGNKFKILRSDCGTEFMNKNLSDYLDQNGIIQETSVPYCPQQNGRAEREIRTMKEGVRTLLQTKKIA